MKTIKSTVPCTGAQSNSVQTEAAVFRPVLRRELLRAIRKCRSRLGLSTGDVLVLDTLLSFLPCRDRESGAETPVTSDIMLIIYASNGTICERANGMDDRVLRRHIKRLCDAGLLARRDSATGKRFPLKSGGKVQTAYGLDLSPLMLAAGQIFELARKIEEEAEEARSLRAQALTLRAELLRRADTLCHEVLAIVEKAKTILRRASLGLEGLRELLAQLTEYAAAPCPATASQHPKTTHVQATLEPAGLQSRGIETVEKSAGDGRNVRQVESPKIETKNTRDLDQDHVAVMRVWDSCTNVLPFFPDRPRSTGDLQETIFLLGKFIGLNERSLARSISTMGWLRSLKAMDYMIGNAERILKPDGYLAGIIRDFQNGRPVAGMS